MNATSIEWADFFANPIRYQDAAGRDVWACVKCSDGCKHCYAESLARRDVWACVKCSDGCKHCYAESLARRFGRGGPFSLQVTRDVTPYFCDKTARKLLTSKKLAGKRVFIGDMTDVFGEWVSFDLLDRLFAVFALRPDVTFQVLTKRPARMAEYLSPGLDNRMHAVEQRMRETTNGADAGILGDDWPLPNVWLGTSVEDQKAADQRIPHLLGCPAAVRFLSVEPLLGPVDLAFPQGCRSCNHPGNLLITYNEAGRCSRCDGTGQERGIDWVIVGGESGPGARACNVEWIRSIVGQCREAGVACFIKQLGSEPYDGALAIGAGECVDSMVARMHDRVRDRKGGDPAEWPEDLRVREFPKGGGR